MADAHDLLSLILEKTGAAEPVSIVRKIGGDGSVAISVATRDEFIPPVEERLEKYLQERLKALELTGGIADISSYTDDKGRESQIVLEIVRPKLKLLIFGAGHVGQAVALIGAMLGYQVAVVDDRQEFLTRQRFPDDRIDLVVHDIQGGAESVGVTGGTAVVIVTRGHQSDEACLKSVLRSKARYLGMIGSRRRILSVFKKLAAEGFTDAELSKVHAPIGLRIGARTPQEIAISILGEIIDCVNNPKPEQRGK